MAAPVHRKNKDGTWDSICLGCFMTIARFEKEAELREQELKHVCHPGRCVRESDRPGRDQDAA